MAKKFEISKMDVEKLRTPECIGCFDRIADYANGVLGSLEVHSDELFQNFDKRTDELVVHIKEKTDESINSYLRTQERKHDEAFELHLEKQVKKEDAAFAEHFKKQATKYDDFEKKVLGLIKWILGIVLGIILLCSGIVAVTWIDMQGKANVSETLSLKDAKELQETGDGYREDRYVIRSENTTQNTYKYIWTVERIFKPKAINDHRAANTKADE